MGSGFYNSDEFISGFDPDQFLQSESPSISDSIFSSHSSQNHGSNNSSAQAFSSSSPSSSSPPSLSSTEHDSPSDDSVIFSDFVLTYINNMLMEEGNLGESYDQFQPAEMLAAEQPFLDILSAGDPPPPEEVAAAAAAPHPPDSFNWASDSIPFAPYSTENSYLYSYNSDQSNSDFNGSVYEPVADFSQIETQLLLANNPFKPYLNSSINTTNNTSSKFSNNNNTNNNNNNNNILVEGLEESMFRKGLEEAQKFLPSSDKLVIDLESSGFYLSPESKSSTENPSFEIKRENGNSNDTANNNNDVINNSNNRGRKNPYRDEHDLLEREGRSNKQTALDTEEQEDVRKMFDNFFLGGHESCLRSIKELREAKQTEQIRMMQNEQNRNNNNNNSNTARQGKGRGKRQSGREVVDLRTLLIHCAQAVATDDRRSANELLRQIRQHASPTGDANQRLAQCFADGLQARLAGTGSQIYQSLSAKRTSAVELLKAYQLYMAACPFKKISFFFSNQTIIDAAEGRERVHVIDFGIHYGFQWPCLLQRLAQRDGGPPLLKITAIDHPQPGFRPAERIQETGRRLTDYAAMFKVPFEYQAIAVKWEDVKIEDLNIDRSEVTVVNCLFQLKNLMDETVSVDSPRDMVLNLIRKMKPDVYIHGIVNGSYNAPFFVTRFREALFHYSALFDMLEANVPRENEQRLLIERDLFGRSALNVIACEGMERVERPETYKQWQVRNLRAGFKQLGLNAEIVSKAREKVKNCYHRDFVVDEDNNWMLQGWKGRIVYALSTWKAGD